MKYRTVSIRGWKNLANVLNDFDRDGYDPLFVTQNSSTVFTVVLKPRENEDDVLRDDLLENLSAEFNESGTGKVVGGAATVYPAKKKEKVGADTDSK